jgi:hypothetical protein
MRSEHKALILIGALLVVAILVAAQIIAGTF